MSFFEKTKKNAVKSSLPSGFSSKCKIAAPDEQIKAHGRIGDIGILDIKKKFNQKVPKIGFWTVSKEKQNFFKNQLESCCWFKYFLH